MYVWCLFLSTHLHDPCLGRRGHDLSCDDNIMGLWSLRPYDIIMGDYNDDIWSPNPTRPWQEDLASGVWIPHHQQESPQLLLGVKPRVVTMAIHGHNGLMMY